MNWVVIVLFCIIPMVAWAATLIAMKGYTLTGAKMKEIQAVNACRRDAVAKGMKLEEAMDKWQTMEQLPEEYRSWGAACDKQNRGCCTGKKPCAAAPYII